MMTICLLTTIFSYSLLILWVFSLLLFWTFKDKITSRTENQLRFILSYALLTFIFILIFLGEKLGIPKDYLSNVTTEIIGVTITVLIIDRIVKYFNSKNEELYRKLSLKVCRMPIYTYCANWFFIFEHDNKKLKEELQKFDDLNSFFKSDEFYKRISSFDFNKLIGENKTYAQYCSERMQEVTDRFEGVLSKYASKLSHKDIPLLEHFGGQAYIFTVFSVMKFVSDVRFTYKNGNKPEKTIMPFNNSFRDIDKKNFDNHFDKLVELINEYNSVIDNEYEKWTIKNISQLQTIKSANNNPTIQW